VERARGGDGMSNPKSNDKVVRMKLSFAVVRFIAKSDVGPVGIHEEFAVMAANVDEAREKIFKHLDYNYDMSGRSRQSVQYEIASRRDGIVQLDRRTR
jgi:hypothetical protein